MDTFINYYRKYLGLDQSDNYIFRPSCGEIIINEKFVQRMLFTKINNKSIFSVSSQFYDKFCEYMKYSNCYDFTEEQVISILNSFFNHYPDSEKCNFRTMYRLTTDIEQEDIKLSNNLVKKLTKDIIFDELHFPSYEERVQYWNRKEDLINRGVQYVITAGGKILSYCKLSDIYYSGANLVVWTSPEYRNKGYGKEVVKYAVRWCKDNDIIPIYWVDSENAASVNLAKSLGFTLKSREIIVLYKNNS